jgi:ribosomal protein S18 acetylase RimI-like enzyme
MIVRPYEKKDFDNCREICYVTSHGFETEARKQALYYLYCDYYLEYESDTCFVVANDKDEAIGYILCADNYKEYEKNYRKYYMSKLKKISKPFWLMRNIDMLLRRPLTKKFPAHMHIDIKPEGQGQGMGHKLVDTLVKTLKEKGVKGLFLVVGKENKKGVSFYRKYGFNQYKDVISGIVFTIDIDKREI